MTHSNESVSAALGALACQRDLEKQGFLEPVVGGAIGAYKSPRGSRLDGAGHGVVTGLGTGLGAGALGGLGAIGGSALGPAGSIAGLLAGLGAGGYGGFRASNAMQRSLRGGPLPYDADFEPKEKSKEKKEKTKDGDGDGKVNDGTPEEKQAFTVPKTPPSGSMSLPPAAASALGTGNLAAQQGVGAARGMRGAMQGMQRLGKRFLTGGATGAPPPTAVASALGTGNLAAQQGVGAARGVRGAMQGMQNGVGAAAGAAGGVAAQQQARKMQGITAPPAPAGSFDLAKIQQKAGRPLTSKDRVIVDGQSYSIPGVGAAAGAAAGNLAAQQGVGAARGVRGAMQGMQNLPKPGFSPGQGGSFPQGMDAGTGGTYQSSVQRMRDMVQNLPRPGFSPGQGGSFPQGMDAGTGGAWGGAKDMARQMGMGAKGIGMARPLMSMGDKGMGMGIAQQGWRVGQGGSFPQGMDAGTGGVANGMRDVARQMGMGAKGLGMARSLTGMGDKGMGIAQQGVGAARGMRGAMQGMQNLPKPGFSPGLNNSESQKRNKERYNTPQWDGKGVAPGKSIMIDNYRRLRRGEKPISQLMQHLGFGKSGSARPHTEKRLQNIKLASTILNMHAIGQELAACNLHQLSKSAAVGAHKEERMKAAALIRQYELEKQALLPGIAQLLSRAAPAMATAAKHGNRLLGFGRKAALPAAMTATGGIIGNEIGHRKGLMDLQQKGSKLPDTAFDGLGGRSGEQPGDFAKSMSRLYEE